MYTNYKVYPPSRYVEDFALDVATVTRLQCLDNNIARYAGRHEQSCYPVGTSGVSGMSYTGTSTNRKFVAPIFHRLPTIGKTGRLFFLAGVSVKEKSYYKIYFYKTGQSPYVFDDSTAAIAVSNALVHSYTVFPDSTSIFWRECIFPMENIGPYLSAFISTVSTDGATNVTTTLYSSHVETELL